jgi:DNA-binding LytR/AlgR family response regulator
VRFLRPPDIDWIEGGGNYVQLHAGGAVYPMRATLRRAAERLRDAGFRRIHHSFIVNLDRVRSIEHLARGDYLVTLEDGTVLETSRSYAANLDPLR